jgi:hypothetical protein
MAKAGLRSSEKAPLQVDVQTVWHVAWYLCRPQTKETFLLCGEGSPRWFIVAVVVWRLLDCLLHTATAITHIFFD